LDSTTGGLIRRYGSTCAKRRDIPGPPRRLLANLDSNGRQSMVGGGAPVGTSPVERDALSLAAQINAKLNDALNEGAYYEQDVRTWNEILRRNGAPPIASRFDMSSLDHVVYCLFGVVGGVLDLTRTFSSSMTSESLHNKFDQLSKSYIEKVTGSEGIAAIDNIKGGGTTHRLFGPGHDLARLLVTLGQIRKGEYHAIVRGVETIATSYRPGGEPYIKIENPFDALVVLLLHLLGDFFSDLSLPIPGRTKRVESEVIEVVREVVREYREGGNFRQQIAQVTSGMTGAALILLALRLYRYFDLALEKRRQFRFKDFGLASDIKYHLLVRNAQAIAFTISIGKAAFTGSVLDVNYTSFLSIVRSGAAINRLSMVEQDRLYTEFRTLRCQIEEL